jgi:glucose/arabinose dehydrogenase
MTTPRTTASVMLAAVMTLAACTSPSEAEDVATTPAPPTSSSLASPPSAHEPGGTRVTRTTGLQAPWSVVFVAGTPLIGERNSARILELDQDGSTREVGVIEGVAAQGESGLLGLAVDERSRLYVYSTGRDGNRIQRYELLGSRGSFSLDEPVTLVDGLPSASYHDGGRLGFGPDGMLYATVGDAGARDSAQDLESLGGKILRVTADGDVPADNPFPGSPVYSYGHRNPQGLAWDDAGTMYASEFGQDTWDELNVITAGGNYGWPAVEGRAGQNGYVDPVQQWTPDVASPSGMTYVDGWLYLANLRGQELRAVPISDPSSSVELFAGTYGRLRDVTVDPDGELWFLSSNTDGRGTPSSQDDQLLRLEIEP